MNVLCHGNTSMAEAAKLVEQCAAALGSSPLRSSQRPCLRLLRLPDDIEVVLRLHPSLCGDAERKLINTAETNSAVEVTLQVRHLPASPRIAPHRPASPRISPHLPT